MSNLLSQASLVMIPSGYKEDVVYSPVPTDGSGDLSFTRASNGTRINSAGLVEVCPWNLNTNSQIFASGWGTDGTSTATDNNTTAPNGTTTAAKVVANTSNGYAYKSLPVAPGTYTLSYYVKASASATITIALNDIGGSGYQASSPFSIGTEWQRIEFSATISSGSNLYIDYGNMQTGKDYFIWGAQLNIGSTAKPYFPTTDRLNVPRLTYQNGGGGCPSLLLEKQSTNLALYSEDFTNGFWTKDTTTTVTANDGISPDGTQNADRFESPSSIKGIYSYGVSGSETISVYIKAGNSGNVGKSATLFTTLATQDFILTNDWQRISVSGAASSLWALYPSATNSFTNVLIWGAQAEQSSYPTSYIPTTSSTATRVADACYKTGISSLIGQSQGTIFIDAIMKPTAGSYDCIMSVNDGAFANSVNVFTNTAGDYYYEIYSGGAVQATQAFSTLPATRMKIAVAWNSTNSVVYANGSLLYTSSSITTPSGMGSFNFSGPNNSYTMGKKEVNEFLSFTTKLTASELIALTTI